MHGTDCLLTWCQVGDKLYVQLPGATVVAARDIVSIQPLVLATAFNAHTMLGEKLRTSLILSGCNCRCPASSLGTGRKSST